MKISMISAMTPARVIGGRDGGIPWSGKLPRDQQHFRNYTQGKWMLLGRKTYEEMEGWFTTQVPVVLTTEESYSLEIGHVANSVDEAIELAKKYRAEELVVSGGASVYEAAMQFADSLELTIVDAEIDGERYFPDWQKNEWDIIDESHFAADQDNEFGLTFLSMRRK